MSIEYHSVCAALHSVCATAVTRAVRIYRLLIKGFFVVEKMFDYNMPEIIAIHLGVFVVRGPKISSDTPQ